MMSSLLLRVSVVLLLVGLVAGIAMGIKQDFTYVPAHAHLNLVGGVLMFLAGLYYRLVPEAGASRLAKVQGTLHIAAAIIFPIGIAAVLTNPKYEPLVIAGSLIVVAAIATFAVIVFRTSSARA
jgi:peptidoglycan/LPS O-acetylase OafA/YrhL